MGSYKTKYIRVTKIKDILVDDQTDKKIRVAGDAKDLVYEYLDNAVVQACQDLVNKLPRKSKGANKGDLKRITLKPRDFENGEEEEEEEE